MRCLGFTRRVARCKLRGEPLFCRHHRWQPVTGILSFLGSLALLTGLYQDLWRPVVEANRPVVPRQVPVEHQPTNAIPQDIDKRIVEIVDDYLVLNTLNDPGTLAGYDEETVYSIGSFIDELPSQTRLVHQKAEIELLTGDNGLVFAAMSSTNEQLLRAVVLLARFYYPPDQFETVRAESHYRSEMHTVRDVSLRRQRLEAGDLGADHQFFALYDVYDFLVVTLFDLVGKINALPPARRPDFDAATFVTEASEMPDLMQAFAQGRLTALDRLRQSVLPSDSGDSSRR